MRTTLNIDDDVLNAAKHEALRINATLRAGADAAVRPAASIGRFTLLPPRDEIIAPAHVRTPIRQEGIKRCSQWGKRESIWKTNYHGPFSLKGLAVTVDCASSQR